MNRWRGFGGGKVSLSNLQIRSRVYQAESHAECLKCDPDFTVKEKHGELQVFREVP